MELYEGNITRVTNWVNNQVRNQPLSANLDPLLFDNVTPEQVMKCCTCFEVPRFPIVLTCGHLQCCDCYQTDFIERSRRRNEAYYCPCPVCRAEVNPFNTRTILQELSLNAESSVSKFYLSLNIKCSNVSCNLYYNFQDISDHEMLKCSMRNIKCPTVKCPCISKVDVMRVHAINCWFNYFWCSTCMEKISVVVTYHDCKRNLKRYKLGGGSSSNYYLNYLHGLEDGDIVLPERQVLPRNDLNVLEFVRNKVRIDRGLRIMNKSPLIKAFDAPVIPDDDDEGLNFLFDETTQEGF